LLHTPIQPRPIVIPEVEPILPEHAFKQKIEFDVLNGCGPMYCKHNWISAAPSGAI
jgi:hypothetical protein